MWPSDDSSHMGRQQYITLRCFYDVSKSGEAHLCGNGMSYKDLKSLSVPSPSEREERGEQLKATRRLARA